MGKTKIEIPEIQCTNCDNPKDLKGKVLRAYNYKESGLNNVTLSGVIQHHCDQCGETYNGFGDVQGLHTLIAKCIIRQKDNLEAKEVKYLRKYLGYSAVVWSKLVGLAPETISRYENGGDIPLTYDRLLRTSVATKLHDRDYDLQDLFMEGKAYKLEWLKLKCEGDHWVSINSAKAAN